MFACVLHTVQLSKNLVGSAVWQRAGAHQGNSISKCMVEMLFVSCFKGSIHRVGEKEEGEKVEQIRCRVVLSTSV